MAECSLQGNIHLHANPDPQAMQSAAKCIVKKKGKKGAGLVTIELT